MVKRQTEGARVAYIPHLSEDNVRKGFLEESRHLALWAELPEHVRPVLAFGYYTGCRKGEILSIRWSQVDLIERVVRLDPGTMKNDEARELPLVPELHEILVLQRQRRDRPFPECPWLFFGQEGERIRDLRRAWMSACTAAGLVDAEGEPTVLFHDLRRTGARNLIRSGVPEAVAMQISGHKTRSIFDRYNIVSGADRREAARRLAGYISERRKQDEAEARKVQSGSSDTMVTHNAKKSVQ
jgi:integrase